MNHRDRFKHMVPSQRRPRPHAGDTLQAKHQQKLRELSNHLAPAVALVEGYFDPPNAMTWTADDDSDWEVVIRKKTPRADIEDEGRRLAYGWMRSGRHG